MKILLTGSGGMVGKNILNHPAAAHFEFLSPSSIELNLLDATGIAKYLKEHNPDFIIHAAGTVGGIQANIAKPVNFLVNNMQMGLNLLMEAKEANIKSVMNLGSSCMYPKNAPNPLTEDLILKGELEPTNEGYALAKVACARLCEYIHREDNAFQYKTIIPCNLYGPFDKFSPEHSHLIPAIIKKMVDAKNAKASHVEIWGDGEARREFMYAGDLADFIFFALKHFAEMPQNLNVGLGHDYSINEYYQAVANVIGYPCDFIHDLSKPVGMKQKLMCDKSLQAFGWRHKISLADGIKKTYEYYLREIKHAL